ncbi:MAG: tRNA epoxyqueuosine(34) reductase QueG [Planctomycetes bacterium]|nr:tRNA epoxyqueuosine(34) reductase QueG [Planctomycetota bacterium]
MSTSLEIVRAACAGEGLELLGVARAHALPDRARRGFESWLERGMHGEMAYVSRGAAARFEPTRVVAGAQSIIVVGERYDSGDRHPVPDDPTRGKLSRYAWGDDYHRVLGRKLERTLERLRASWPGAGGRWYVDTGPVLERAWAEASGVGFIGKNGNVISTRLGSWLFLGVILLAVDVTPTPSAVPRCGTCTRCIPACPTGAIVADGVVDSRLCISYLTIELRGAIPRELRPKIGSWVFGCDVCQDVCPWNARLERTRAEPRPDVDPAYRPRGGETAPRLAELAKLDEAAFRARFRGTPVLRTKRRGLLRNVAVALGNSRSPSAMAPLRHLLADPEPIVRAHAAWGLGEIGGDAARRALAERRDIETDATVLEEIDLALVQARGQDRDRFVGR